MLATSMRGYGQYARTGNNFAVFSTELRLPVVTTFVKRPIQSAILKNMQVVAFTDVGTAWHGFIPDAEARTTTYNFPKSPPLTGPNNVFLTFSVPENVAVGFGGGLRTSLFGYFLRTDFAWNAEGRRQPMVHVALGVDF
jgi:outer membrane protein assembly factor BamA